MMRFSDSTEHGNSAGAPACLGVIHLAVAVGIWSPGSHEGDSGTGDADGADTLADDRVEILNAGH